MRTNDREDTKRILLNSVGLDISKVGLYTTAEDAAAGVLYIVYIISK